MHYNEYSYNLDMNNLVPSEKKIIDNDRNAVRAFLFFIMSFVSCFPCPVSLYQTTIIIVQNMSSALLEELLFLYNLIKVRGIKLEKYKTL